jgi:rhamnulokinase
MSTVSVAAVDLGASNGRVLRAEVGSDTLTMTEVVRFANEPVRIVGTLHWDILALYRGVLDGLRAAGPVDSIGIDTWGVDYGLLDSDGRLLGNPVHYRDNRTDGVPDAVLTRVPSAELYAATGIPVLPFNTVFQLAAMRGSAQLAAARDLLLIPDLITYWLTGEVGAERTNASTTQLLDVTTGRWATALIERLGLPPALFPALREPGSTVGGLRPEIVGTVGWGTPVTAVGSHDTASAIAAVPATSDRFAYISCGTWSLVGVELDHPVLSDDSRNANFTNEVGVDGTIRYLHNVMGLWLLQECQRAWGHYDVAALIAEAARVPAFASVIDADDPAFLPTGDMPARIANACRARGERVPADPPQTVRCILDSLALAHRRAVHDAQRLSGRAVDVIHMVGGGTRNELLCQLTADACGLPVEAGPVEATAIGNALVQARALGAVGPDLAALRSLIRATQLTRRYEPAGEYAAIAAAAARLG